MRRFGTSATFLRHIGCYRGDLPRLLSCTVASVVDCNRRPHETSLLHCCKCGCIETGDLPRLLSCTVASVAALQQRISRDFSLALSQVWVHCNRRPHETSLLHCCKCGCIATGDLPRLLSSTVASVCGLQRV